MKLEGNRAAKMILTAAFQVSSLAAEELARKTVVTERRSLQKTNSVAGMAKEQFAMSANSVFWMADKQFVANKVKYYVMACVPSLVAMDW